MSLIYEENMIKGNFCIIKIIYSLYLSTSTAGIHSSITLTSELRLLLLKKSLHLYQRSDQI